MSVTDEGITRLEKLVVDVGMKIAEGADAIERRPETLFDLLEKPLRHSVCECAEVAEERAMREARSPASRSEAKRCAAQIRHELLACTGHSYVCYRCDGRGCVECDQRGVRIAKQTR